MIITFGRFLLLKRRTKTRKRFTINAKTQTTKQMKRRTKNAKAFHDKCENEGSVHREGLNTQIQLNEVH
ncbi:hypothetical protein, partial [Vibrio sp. 10N.261.54.E10]|uniref:hypothetical protein n=1 Tax=Vibrio sp. 10N.261.54.E10 TaxID=1884475 RepID=UPI0039A70772